MCCFCAFAHIQRLHLEVLASAPACSFTTRAGRSLHAKAIARSFHRTEDFFFAMRCGTDLTIRQAPDLPSAPSLIEPPVTDNRAVLHCEQPVQSATALFEFKLSAAPPEGAQRCQFGGMVSGFFACFVLASQGGSHRRPARSTERRLEQITNISQALALARTPPPHSHEIPSDTDKDPSFKPTDLQRCRLQARLWFRPDRTLLP